MSEPYQKEIIRKNLSERTYQKELCLLFAFFFSQSERTERLDPPAPGWFSFAF